MVAAKHKAIRRGAPQAFPRKLYDLINVEPDSIISWSDLGDSFYLHDQPKFIADVLPRHFRHNHFSSFQRQLNLYGEPSPVPTLLLLPLCSWFFLKSFR
mmetsp:Transcript_29697/g.46360  ORF Transcript_29697/g.46360 Transcript_29697/m.46360 type:complete len:99 (-) Transcript_29697:889-1185(-)